MNLLDKILTQGLKKNYLLLSTMGIVLGLSLSTICVDVYLKISQSVMKSGGSDSYMIVNKQVSLLNTIGLSDNSFDEAEIQDIKNQPFVDDVGKITASSCRIWAFRDQAPLKFKTDVFFESLEDKFLDKKPRRWKWNLQDKFVPIMVNSDFLNLYNFAFAKAQNLPQFTASTIGQFVVFLEVRGQGKKRLFEARVVGVSDRIPSIIVPQKFLSHINQIYGKKDDHSYSRIILKVNNPSNADLKSYFAKHGIIANQDLLSSGKTKTILSSFLGSYGLLALVILVLAVVVVVISFQLMVSSSSASIQLLKDLGTHSRELIKHYQNKFYKLLLAQVLMVAVLVLIAGYFSQQYLGDAGYQVSPVSLWAMVVLFISTGSYVWCFNYSIKKIVKAS